MEFGLKEFFRPKLYIEKCEKVFCCENVRVLKLLIAVLNVIYIICWVISFEGKLCPKKIFTHEHFIAN